MTSNGTPARILIVEDDPEMGGLLQRGLTAQGYEVDVVGNGVDALIALARQGFALAAIDVMLPTMTGFEVCRRIRDSGSPIPVLLLTARTAVEDRVFGLDCGADDYLTKPFAFTELTARIRALLRRDGSSAKLVVTVGVLALDSLAMTAVLGQKKLPLSPKEFALLRLLAASAGDVVPRVRILEEVWGTVDNIDANIVDQYVSYLRRKLAASGGGVRISTVRGEGYLLEPVG